MKVIGDASADRVMVLLQRSVHGRKYIELFRVLFLGSGVILTKKRAFVWGIALLVLFMIGMVFLLCQSFHPNPFQRNGTKEAIVFRDFGKDYSSLHDLEYIGTTQVMINGEIKSPLFAEKKFQGMIDIAYFREQKIINSFEAMDVAVDKNNGMERIVVYQHILGSKGQPLAGFPVDLRLFFHKEMPYEILKVSWERRGDYVYWLVNGAGDEEEAKEALERFFAWPKEDVLDALFY